VFHTLISLHPHIAHIDLIIGISTSIKFYLLIGELNKALLQINEAIQEYPENLEIRLLWINIVYFFYLMKKYFSF
jgi:hypothetical protein